MAHTIINCFKKKNLVINKKLKKVSVEEGLEIAISLFEVINKRRDAIGLAANQIGIDAQVAVVNVREPLILINPAIKEQWDEIDFYESCLSFPSKGVYTKRYKNVIIQTAQEDGSWYFSGVKNSTEGKGSWEEDQNKIQDEQLRLLEAVCVQHEIAHLQGKTVFDYEVKQEPIRVKNKWKRNEIVSITNGKEYKEIKYKKAKSLIDSGEWEIYIGGPIT